MPRATTLPGYAAERPSHPMHALHLMLAALSLALVVLGAQLTLSGVADFQTRSFLADWEAHRTPPSPQAWAVAHAAATRAAIRYPVPHGAYLERREANAARARRARGGGATKRGGFPLDDSLPREGTLAKLGEQFRAEIGA